MSDKPTIHQAMAAVMADVGAVDKDGNNPEFGYRFRGVDQVMNALHPVLASHGVYFTPQVLERTYQQLTTSRGKAMHHVVLRVRFTFYGPDGSSVSTVTEGEGQDTQDKGTNKAMSAALKYALIQTFCIPTQESMDDSDGTAGEETVTEPPATSEQRAAIDAYIAETSPEQAKQLAEWWKSERIRPKDDPNLTEREATAVLDWIAKHPAPEAGDEGESESEDSTVTEPPSDSETPDDDQPSLMEQHHPTGPQRARQALTTKEA